MDINDVESLGKLADLCRKKGIESIKVTVDGIEFKLKDVEPPVKRGRKRRIQEKTTEDLIEETPFGEDAALFWSSTGVMDEATSG